MLAVAILNPSQHEQKTFRSGSLRLGSDLELPGALGGEAVNHWVVEDPQIAAQQMDISWSDLAVDSSIRLANRGRSLALSSGPRIHRGRSVELQLPASFRVGDTQVQLFDTDAKHALDFGLTGLSLDSALSQSDPAIRISPGPETLAAWLDSMSDLQRAASGSHELFKLAAKAVFNPGGLDGAMVLLPTSEGWQIAASHIPYPDHGIGFREDLVTRAATSLETIYHDATITDRETGISDLHSAVVCPVIGEANEVVAAVYGFRSLHRRNSRRGIRPLEAQFVQVVADALSAGMIRLESEAKAARSKVLLEQAFSPNIARQLQTNPRFLDAHTREVSVLFADLRGFSSISERIGTRDTYQLLADVMDCFSDVIADLDGVIIDFYGDGLSAFWNAPLDQPEHALLACHAGMEMIRCLPQLNRLWAERVGEELRIGIGIHTGVARVGNSGSRRRLKYGPRGATVNLASRLENVTKQIGIPLLVSRETACLVESSYHAQRIIRTTLDGISEPTDIFRIIPGQRPECEQVLQSYESALHHFEAGNLERALSLLEHQAQASPDDPATKYLLGVVLQQLEHAGTSPRADHGLIDSNSDLALGD